MYWQFFPKQLQRIKLSNFEKDATVELWKYKISQEALQTRRLTW